MDVFIKKREYTVDVYHYKETGIYWMCRVIKKRESTMDVFIKKREYYGGCVYKETLLRWMCRVIKKRFFGCVSYKETGILWWMCRVIKKREYYGGCVEL